MNLFFHRQPVKTKGKGDLLVNPSFLCTNQTQIDRGAPLLLTWLHAASLQDALSSSTWKSTLQTSSSPENTSAKSSLTKPKSSPKVGFVGLILQLMVDLSVVLVVGSELSSPWRTRDESWSDKPPTLADVLGAMLMSILSVDVQSCSQIGLKEKWIESCLNSFLQPAHRTEPGPTNGITKNFRSEQQHNTCWRVTVRCVTRNKACAAHFQYENIKNTILSTYTCAEIHMGGCTITINIWLHKIWWGTMHKKA